jgi:integrase
MATCEKESRQVMAKQSSRGQILEREYGFLVRVFIGRDPKTGKRKYVNKKVRTKRKKEAEQALTALLRKQDMGDLLATTPLTVKEHVEDWLENIAKQGLSGKTFKEYKGMMKRYIYDPLGSIKLSKLSGDSIQKVYGKLSERGLSPRTIRYCHHAFSSSLKYAVIDKRINNNPAQHVKLPKRVKPEMNAMSKKQSEAFLHATKSSRLHVFFTLMLGTGLRPGEALALMWRDFDAMNRTLTIVRSFGDVGEGDGFKPTKTEKGRQVKLPEDLTKLLLDYKEKQPFESDLIFPNANGTPYNERNVDNRYFKPILEAAKLGEYVIVMGEDGKPIKDKDGNDKQKFVSPFRVYDLRHTHATLLLLAGVHPKIVQERLGHSSIVLTMDTYSHVLPGMQDEAASKLDALLTFYPQDDSPRVAN